MEAQSPLDQQKALAKDFYQKSQLREAHNHYSLCLPLCSQKQDYALIYSNLCQCSLKLGLYEQAFKEVEEALKFQQNSPLDKAFYIKLRYRINIVLLHCKEYDQANKSLGNLKKFSNLEQRIDLYKELDELHEKVSSLINHRKGKFRIKNLEENYDKKQDFLNLVGDFVSEKIKMTMGSYGRSIVGQKQIYAGELIVVQQALCWQEIKDGHKDRMIESIQALQKNNPTLFNELISGLQGGSNDKTLFDLQKLVGSKFEEMLQHDHDEDLLFLEPKEKIKDILQYNSFRGTPLFQYKEIISSESLFIIPSFFNHSCVPNVLCSYLRPNSSVIFMKAIKDISPGEELFISYSHILQPFSQRQNLLRERYGFTCQCSRCATEQIYLEQMQQFDSMQQTLQPESLKGKAINQSFLSTVASFLREMNSLQQKVDPNYQLPLNAHFISMLLDISDSLLLSTKEGANHEEIRSMITTIEIMFVCLTNKYTKEYPQVDYLCKEKTSFLKIKFFKDDSQMTQLVHKEYLLLSSIFKKLFPTDYDNQEYVFAEYFKQLSQRFLNYDSSDQDFAMD